MKEEKRAQQEEERSQIINIRQQVEERKLHSTMGRRERIG